MPRLSRLRICWLCAVLVLWPALTLGSSLSLRAIADGLIQGWRTRECNQYCVTGACQYLVCTLFLCKIHTTQRIRHRSPDLVVVAWNGSEHPWGDFVALLRILTGDMSSGGTTSKRRQRQSSLHFSEVDVIGQPLVLSGLAPGVLCPQRTVPLMPYYSSRLDAHLWRSGATELLGIAQHSERVRSPTTGESWGWLYPRKGFAETPHSTAMAVLAALRGLSIATDGGVHLHIRLPHGTRRQNRRRSVGFREAVASACWQQIMPTVERKCHPMNPDWEPEANQGNHAWLLWSEYECCAEPRGRYLGAISSRPLCL